MFDELYNSQLLRPDQMKIYPCEIVPWTKIKEWFDNGTYKPYGSGLQLSYPPIDAAPLPVTSYRHDVIN